MFLRSASADTEALRFFIWKGNGQLMEEDKHFYEQWPMVLSITAGGMADRHALYADRHCFCIKTNPDLYHIGFWAYIYVSSFHQVLRCLHYIISVCMWVILRPV